MNRSFPASFSSSSANSHNSSNHAPLHLQYSYDCDDRPHVPITTTPAAAAAAASNHFASEYKRRETPAPPTYHLQPRSNPQRTIINSSGRRRQRPPLILDANQSPSSVSPFQSPLLTLPTPPPVATTTPSATANAAAGTTTIDESALAFARQAPLAGFLSKRGATIDTFKRRFFVLQPATHLYYFLTAHDTAPRGCLDLYGARVERLGNDGGANSSSDVHRFALVWDTAAADKASPSSTNSNRSNNNKKEPNRVVLEARSREEADQWIKALTEQRLSYSQAALQKQQLHNSAQRSRIAELEQQVAQYKHMETERDGAVQDAAHWKRQLELLDESIRKLTQQLRPKSEATLKEKDEDADNNIQSSTAATQDTSSASSSSHDSNIEKQNTDSNESTEIDVRHVPGTYFGGLVNTVEQLRENLRLASEEAATAVEDVVAANERVRCMETRLDKAEKHLCKIWEENCALRKQIKQKKREKRVLVREVKNLRNAAAAVSREIRRSIEPPRKSKDGDAANKNSEDDDDDDEEDKLLKDLENHVQSSLRLHEEFMAANGEIQAKLGGYSSPSAAELENGMEISAEEKELRELLDSTVQLASSNKKRSSPNIHPNVPLFENKQQSTLPIASLFDQSDEDESNASDVGLESVAASVVSSVGAEASDINHLRSNHETAVNLMDESSVEDASPERPNPLLELEEDESDQPHLCPTSSQSESSSARARRHEATSKLSCPLADVVSTSTRSDPSCDRSNKPDDLRVYHLTFYSRKIGIQFQKVPPPPTRPRGLLTDALTADLANVSSAGEKTAAELRRIASISTRGGKSSAKKGDDKETSCDVATPVDAVLVCGFEGFDDDSGNNERPKLGARLVAFDGVSIEVGRWTFDSVRKSIQARGRPLTLSFRNDFLTTEQRRILTKAIQDVQPSPPLPVPTALLSYGSGSVHSNKEDDAVSAATSGSDNNYYRSSMPQSFSGTKSVASSSAASAYQRASFSEATSSSSVLSAVAPLVSNILSSRNREPFTPEYLKRAPESVEATPQHQDFKSELL